MIEFRIMGSMDLRDPDRGHEIRSLLGQPKRLALLAYLTVVPGFHRRDTLLGLLWPNATAPRARHALSQALYVIRRSLREEVVQTNGSADIAADSSILWCDAVAFEEALEEGDLAGALALYRGDLLDGFYVSDAPEFEQWIERERTRLRRHAIEAACRLSEQLEGGKNAIEAVRWARLAASLAPYDERVALRLIELLHRLGNRSGAIAEYERFARDLERDLDVNPSAESVAVVEGIRRDLDGIPEDVSGSGDDETPNAMPRTTEGPASARFGRSMSRLGVVAISTLVALSAWLFWTPDRPSLHDSRRVLVLPLENQTGDSTLAFLGALAADRIAQGLVETDLVDVVAYASVSSVRSLNHAARAVGAGKAVWGAYYLDDKSVLFEVRVSRLEEDDQPVSVGNVSASRADVRSSIEDLRERVMGVVAMAVDERLEQWSRYASQPRHFAAYREFVTGLDLHLVHGEADAAAEHYLRASALDSSFTLPLVWALWVVRTGATGDSIIDYLSVEPDRLAPLDLHLLDYHRAKRDRDPVARYRAILRVVDLAPTSEYLYKAGQSALHLNRPREAIELLTRTDPSRGWLKEWDNYWWALATSYHHVGDFEQQLAAVRGARRQLPGSVLLVWMEADALAALGRMEELRAVLEEGLVLPPMQGQSPGKLMLVVARELRAHGYPRDAEDMGRRAIQWFDNRPEGYEVLLNDRAMVAQELARVGRYDEAVAVIEDLAAMGLGDHPVALFSLGYVAAVRGDKATAMEYLKRLEVFEDRGIGTENAYGTPGSTLALMAELSVMLGNRERGIDRLVEAFARGHREYFWLHRNPNWDAVRTHPRFQELIRPKG